MPTFPSEPPSHGAPPSGAESYRLLVRASASGKKQFIWEIMDDTKGQCVEASRDTFRSFEDAYKAGQSALEYWRAKATQTAARGLLRAIARDPTLGARRRP